MSHPTTISPLEAFKKTFGYINWGDDIDSLLYPFTDKVGAEKAHRNAIELIMKKGFTLIASVGQYSWKGEMKDALFIRPVPEEYTFADEVRDDEHYEEEKAEWL